MGCAVLAQSKAFHRILTSPFHRRVWYVHDRTRRRSSALEIAMINSLSASLLVC
jgi:hypothetical protein